jgi:Universal stress protein UspA and related nucleotide-binding proteins
MYSKVLVPLDGSKTAENVLPLARCFARSLQIPVELLAVVDLAEIGRHLAADQASMIRTLVDDTTRRFGDYLERVAKNFPVGQVQCLVRHGNAAEAIIEAAAADKQTLIAMATHGRSGLDRWLLGSVAGKSFTDRGKSNAGGASEGRESHVGNGYIEANHRTARWIRVVGTHFALRRRAGKKP